MPKVTALEAAVHTQLTADVDAVATVAELRLNIARIASASRAHRCLVQHSRQIVIFKKIVIVGGASLAILGVGTAASASAPAATGSPTPAVAAPAAHQVHAHRGHAQSRALHGQWVRQNGTKFITHDEIRGAVTAVSSTSISVKAADGVTDTYSVGAGVKVHLKTDGKGHPGTIGQVKVGDRVAVTGVGTGPLTAQRVLDRGAGTTK